MPASESHGLCPAALARIFVMKIGVLPERVLVPLLNDRMVAKGTILAFVTDFFVDFLATGSVDDLVSQPWASNPHKHQAEHLLSEPQVRIRTWWSCMRGL